MTPQGLDGLIAVDNPITQRYDQKSPHSAQRLDDAINE